MSGQLCLKWNNHASAFNKLLHQIFLEEGNGYSDATILCHGKFYPVHRFVLSTCSEYFEEMFQQCILLNNKHPFIIVKDIHPEQMEALLNYMYKGEVCVTQENLPEFMKSAEAFKIKGLAVPDADEFPLTKKRTTSSQSPLPKKSKKDEECFNFSQNCENENPNSFEPIRSSETISPIELCEVKSEPVDSIEISEEISSGENFNDCLAIEKEDNFYYEMDKNIESLDCNNSNDQFQRKQESEQLIKEEFQPFDGAECNQNDPANTLMDIAPSTSDQEPADQNSNETVVKRCPFAGCSYSSGRAANLKVHIRTHTGEKPYNCTLCSYRSAKKSDVTKHLRVHTGEKPYECNICQYKASRNDVLLKHIRTHTGEKPYKCLYCSYTSSFKGNLDYHIKTHIKKLF